MSAGFLTPTNVALALRVSAELLGLVNTAVARGDDITEEELAAAFARKNQAMAQLRSREGDGDGPV